MNKIAKFLISFMLVIGIYACSNLNINQEYVGKYLIVEMTNGETVYTEDELRGAGVNYFIELKDDGKIIANLGYGELEGTWSNEAISIDDDIIPYTFENNTIKLEDEGYSIVFRK